MSMWERVLQSHDQRGITDDWEMVLDAMVDVGADHGRSLADSKHAAKLQALCNKVLKLGFSPTALALQILIDLRTIGISAVNKRVIAIAEFLDAHPEVESHQDWMAGDRMQALSELFASEPFLLPLPRTCRFVRNAKGLVIGEGSVPDDAFDDYRRSGKGYAFSVKEVDIEELRFAHLAVAQAAEALASLEQTHRFHVTAYRNVLAAIQRTLTGSIPDLAVVETEPTAEAVLHSAPVSLAGPPATVEDAIGRLLARCSDAWERPYLDAAQRAFVRETGSLRDALAAVALLPPSLEAIGPLLAEDLFDFQSSADIALPRGLDSLEAAQAELEKRGSHRITRSFLRRTKELSGQDDAARIKALTEDRERWHRVVAGSLASKADPAAVATPPDTAEDPISRLLARCSDAWERPYLIAARLAFSQETSSLRDALAAVALLPPTLESIGPLLAEDLFDVQLPADAPPLPSGLDSPESLLSELEKRGSHRITRNFLRRAKDLSNQDDTTRIKALTEDRERWHRVVEGRLTSTAVLHARVGALLSTWVESDPGSPCVPLLSAAKTQLERNSPVLEGERFEGARAAELPAPRQQGNKPPTGSHSTSALCRALEKIILIAPHVTGNPLAVEALRRAFLIASATMQHPKGTT